MIEPQRNPIDCSQRFIVGCGSGAQIAQLRHEIPSSTVSLIGDTVR